MVTVCRSRILILLCKIIFRIPLQPAEGEGANVDVLSHFLLYSTFLNIPGAHCKTRVLKFKVAILLKSCIRQIQ